MEEINEIRLEIEAKNRAISDVQNNKEYLENLFAGVSHAETQLEQNIKYMVNAFKIQTNKSVIFNCAYADTDNPENKLNKIFFCTRIFKNSVVK